MLLVRKRLTLGMLMAPALFLVFSFFQYGVLYTFSESDIVAVYYEGRLLFQGSKSHQIQYLTDLAYYKMQDLADFDNYEPIPYTHNPWLLPRVASGVFQLLGVRDFMLLNLILCLLGQALYVVFGRKLLRPGSWLALCFFSFLSLDYFAFLRFQSNSALCWYAVLFCACFYPVLARSHSAGNRFVACLAFFALWQFVIPFALWLTLSVIVFAAWCRVGHKSRYIQVRGICMYALFGSAISLTLFLAQLLTHYGLSGLAKDFRTTVRQRNTQGVEEKVHTWSELVAAYDQPMRAYIIPSSRWQALRHTAAVLYSQYNIPILFSCIIGLFCPFLIWMARFGALPNCVRFIFEPSRSERARHRQPMAFLWSLCTSFLLVLALFPGEVYMLYVRIFGPMLVFILALSFSLGLLHFAAAFWRLIGALTGLLLPAFASAQKGPILKFFLFLMALGTFALPVVAASLRNLSMYAPLDGGLFWALKDSQFQGKTLATIPGQEYLLFFAMPLTNVNQNYPRTDYSSADYVIYVDHWQSLVPFQPGTTNVPRTEPRIVLDQFIALGHTVVNRSPHFAIIKLDHTRPLP